MTLEEFLALPEEKPALEFEPDGTIVQKMSPKGKHSTLQGALVELINQTAKMQYMSDGRLTMPLVLRGCIGLGNSAAAHHTGTYHALFTQLPGFRVVVPSTPRDPAPTLDPPPP